MRKQYIIPNPVLDAKEEHSLFFLNRRYEKLCKPSPASKLGAKVSKVIPAAVKNNLKTVLNSFSEQELYEATMGVISKSFKILEETAAKYTIPKKTIIKKINKTLNENTISNADEICLARGYDISAIVSSLKTKNMFTSLVEGAGTGALGFAGLPFNLVLITFICYRAVQMIAMCYGYDVEAEPSELIIASDVFMNALSPTTANSDEISSTIVKIMTIAEVQTLKEASKRTYVEMAKQGGLSLLTVQLRALANNAAKKALEETANKGLENSIFKGVFEQIGKRITKKGVTKLAPGISAVIGAAFDVSQMNTVIDYADVFYNKRFILEKEDRINMLIGESIIIEADFSDGEGEPEKKGND